VIQAQIVCKNTTKGRVRKVLEDFGLADKLKPLHGHLLVELPVGAPTDEILMACRTCAYSYLRLAAWERGGACEATSDAVCIAGEEGQPLVPVVERLGENHANKRHALFVSKFGLTVAGVTRKERNYFLNVTRYTIHKHIISQDTMLFDEFDKSPQQWLEDYRGTVGVDKYIPLVRAVLRKSECVFCTHGHYREVEERSEK